MRRLVLPLLVLLVCVPANRVLHAEPGDGSLVLPSVANQHGLDRVWFTQVRLTPGGEIVDLKLHVSATSAQTLYRVRSAQGPTYTISDRDLDIFGAPLGDEGAGKAAADKVRLLRLEGIEAEIEKAVVPDITLFVATSAGMIYGLDAETGSQLWETAVGSIYYPTTTLAMCDQRLAVVNGQSLYLIDTGSGKVLETRRVVGGPGAGPAIVEDVIRLPATKRDEAVEIAAAAGEGESKAVEIPMVEHPVYTVYLPLLNGQLKAYRFGKNANWWPLTFYSRGACTVPPTQAGTNVAWANNAGDISIINNNRQGVRVRIKLEDPIAGPVIFAPPDQLLAVTKSGYVYSFTAERGRLMWRYASGDQTAQPAAIVDDKVFLTTRYNGLHAISTATGQRVWATPYAEAVSFAAATTDRVYCTDQFGNLVALSAQTGHPLGSVPLNPTDRIFANNITDRVYVATRDGVLQCLRELGADLPTLHLGEKAAAADEEPATEEKPEEPKEEEPPAGAVDPFRS